ncbi:hypothetical protein N8I77_011347 [Diaporthe amygdali]|uniref:Uncharacterized protein n=1 Tax=Phomopsis amygdali TaxID=1214568 RepID=A0AAD9S592_PHOAM|nr:hypothetical protein N8I77_011347 [Diaporthe amygdali]
MPWTPVSEGLEYTWRMFPDLTFFTKSDYFGEPVEEVDRNWSELLPDSPIAIPKSSLNALEIKYDERFTHPPRDSTRVLALPEVFVQLGCINLLRQHVVRLKDKSAYSRIAAFQGTEEDIMHQADLCIERLRETFMCWGDLSTILQQIITAPGDTVPRSAMDLATKHKCRDFSAIAGWTKENAIESVRMNDLWWSGRVFY